MTEFTIDHYILVASMLGILVFGIYKKNPLAGFQAATVSLGIMLVVHRVTHTIQANFQSHLQRKAFASPDPSQVASEPSIFSPILSSFDNWVLLSHAGFLGHSVFRDRQRRFLHLQEKL